MSAVEPRAWLVDLDGTLYHARPLKLLMAGELLLSGLPVLSVIREFRHAHEELRERGQGAPESDPFQLQLGMAAERLGKSTESIEPTIRRWMVERPGKWLRPLRRRSLIREIEAFRARGGRCALVSDYPARQKLSALGLTELFEVVVASGESQGPTRLKPDPSGYLTAARLLGLDPAECLVVGDRDDADGAAARAAGMAFRWIA